MDSEQPVSCNNRKHTSFNTKMFFGTKVEVLLVVLLSIILSFHGSPSNHSDVTPSLPTSIQWSTEGETPKPCQRVANMELNITWWSAKPDECVTSKPFCLNRHMEIAYRCCHDGQWDQEPSCTQIQRNPPPCPEGYFYHEAKELCYSFTDSTQFPPNCINKNTVSFDDYKTILDELKHDPVWMPVTRDYTSGIGFYSWTELTANYKSYFILNGTVNMDGGWENDCFVYYNGTAKSISCKEYYRGMCAYNKLASAENYCTQTFGAICKPQHYLNHTKCFCVMYSASGEVDRIQGADLLHPFQNSIIKVLTTDCLIGLERRDGDEFFWINSNTTLTYAYWSPNANFSHGNKYGVATAQGWILQKEMFDAKCLIYEKEVEGSEPELSLAFNETTSLFELSIKNEMHLRKFSGGRDSVAFCFTDASDMPEIIYRYIIYERNGTNLTFSPMQKGPGHYWCEAVRYFDFEIIKSETILFEPLIFGCEYIAIIVYNNYANIIPTSDAVNTVQKIFSLTLPDYYVRVFKIISFDEYTRQMKFNIHFTQKTAMTDCINDFYPLRSKVAGIVFKQFGLLSFEGLYSRKFCISVIDPSGLQWPNAQINATVYPRQPCLDEYGHFVTRTCVGNFTDGARWLPPSGVCKVLSDSQISEELFSFLISDIPMNQIVDGLCNISAKAKQQDFGSFDVYLLSRILTKVSQNSAGLLQQLLNITSFVDSFNKNTLASAQNDFDATDQILNSLDVMFSNIIFWESNPKLSLNSDRILLKATDVSITNASGVILYKNGDLFNLEFLDDESFLTNLVKADTFQAALVIPAALKKQIIESKSNNNSLVFAVFIQDALFNPPSNQTGKVKNISQIFDVLIPGFDEEFVEPISILYKDEVISEEKSCAHWNFHDVKGYWKNDNTSIKTETGMKCKFWHITHFALLFIDDDEDLILSEALDLITDVNCLLSLVGLFFILLTAVLFKRWRTNTGNKILINFVFAIAIQICLLYTSDLVHRYVKVDDICTIAGVMLHYSIISEFCWMLIVAILQFKRFVEVLGGQPKYIILKACMVGWILPLFPTLCVLFLDPKSYVKNKVGLCYPTGLSLYLSIWLPVGIIVAINSVIFVYILFSVTTKNTECLIDNKDSYYQWRLAVLLFFMLGLTWSFGLLIQLDFGVLFVYLFTFSATLQGFIMFLFFIVFNKNTRVMYMQSIRNCFYPEKLH